MIKKALTLVGLCLVSSCSHTDHRISGIEQAYAKVFELEQQVGDRQGFENVVLVAQKRLHVTDSPDLLDPFWLVSHADLRLQLSSLDAEPEKRRVLLDKLIQRYGIIAPMAAFKRSVAVERFVAAQFEYAIDLDENRYVTAKRTPLLIWLLRLPQE